MVVQSPSVNGRQQAVWSGKDNKKPATVNWDSDYSGAYQISFLRCGQSCTTWQNNWTGNDQGEDWSLNAVATRCAQVRMVKIKEPAATPTRKQDQDPTVTKHSNIQKEAKKYSNKKNKTNKNHNPRQKTSKFGLCIKSRLLRLRTVQKRKEHFDLNIYLRGINHQLNSWLNHASFRRSSHPQYSFSLDTAWSSLVSLLSV